LFNDLSNNTGSVSGQATWGSGNPYDCANNSVAFAGGSGISSDPYVIATVEQLQNLRCDSSAYYQLTANLDLLGKAFPPLPILSGVFDGNGHTISNFSARYPNLNSIGFFTTVSGQVLNLTLSNINVYGRDYTGGLVGSNGGTIQNSSTSGTVSISTGGAYSGGLAGSNSGTVLRSHASSSVTVIGGGGYCNGGLVGYLFGSGLVDQSYATGSVSSGDQSGGLVGYNRGATIRNSYATGAVIGGTAGFLGINNGGVVTNSYAASSSRGSGGFIGFGWSDTVTNSYWDTETSGQATSSRGMGKTTAEMKTASTFAGWDTAIWNLVNGQYPTLK